MSIPYLNAAMTPMLLQIKQDLDRHEGFREYAYPDPLSPIGRKYKGKDWPWGKVPARQLLARIGNVNIKDGAPWTYGFGFTHGVTPDSRIVKTTAERRLESLILQMNTVLESKLPWFRTSSIVTKTVLINMAFNMGVDGLLNFRNTLALIKAKDYDSAARNMRLSRWYTQVGSRAKELVERISSQTIEPQHQARDTING